MEQFSELSIKDMVRTWNEMVLTATDLGMVGRKTRSSFHDRTDGLKHLEEFHSSITAFRSGQRAETNRGPGLERMQEQLGADGTEQLRNQVVQDQQKALESAASQPKKEAPVAKTESKRGRAPAYGDDQHIQVMAEGNPKRQGTRAHEVFAFYRTGMRVDTFVQKVGDTTEAMGHLRWDASKGLIKVTR